MASLRRAKAEDGNPGPIWNVFGQVDRCATWVQSSDGITNDDYNRDSKWFHSGKCFSTACLYSENAPHFLSSASLSSFCAINRGSIVSNVSSHMDEIGGRLSYGQPNARSSAPSVTSRYEERRATFSALRTAAEMSSFHCFLRVSSSASDHHPRSWRYIRIRCSGLSESFHCVKRIWSGPGGGKAVNGVTYVLDFSFAPVRARVVAGRMMPNPVLEPLHERRDHLHRPDDSLSMPRPRSGTRHLESLFAWLPG